MSTLLVQSCSAAKNEVTEPTRALDVYDGYFFRIIKKAMREGEFRADLDLCILSAEYGLIGPDAKIVTYDRRMTSERATELRESVTAELIQWIEQGEYNKVVLNTGLDYELAIGDITNRTSATVVKIDGEGIGYKGKELKHFVRTKEETHGVTV